MSNHQISLLINYSNKCSELVNKICEPIYNLFGITDFFYAKTTSEGIHSAVDSNIEFQEYYFSNKLYVVSPEFTQPHSLPQGCFFYHNILSDEYQNSLSIAAQKLDNTPCIGFVYRTKKNEVIRFGYGIPHQQIYKRDLFLNNLQLLSEFNRFFLNEAKEILKEADNYAIDLKEDLGSNFNSKINNASIENLRKFQFLSQIVGLKGCAVEKLTSREIECLKYLHRGMTSLQIGKKLFISSRTVEFHLANIKDKYHFSKKSELFKLAEVLQMAGYFEELIHG